MRADARIRTAVIVFAVLNLLDIASTYFALKAGFYEGNQIPSLLLAAGGESAMYLFKALVSLVVIATVVKLSPHFTRLGYGLYAANLILALVVIQNLAQLLAA